MIQTQQVDLRGLGKLFLSLRSALVGAGGNGDLAEIVKDESARFSLEMGKPDKRQEKKTTKGISRDVRGVFAPKPKDPFTGKQARGTAGVTWLKAGPTFLSGVPNTLAKSGGTSTALFYGYRGRMPKDAYTETGKRGKQHVQLLCRIIASKPSISGLVRKIAKGVGKRSASFSETAGVLGSSAKVPAASRRHFPTGKNITKPALGGESPSITFGSEAKGVSLLANKVKAVAAIRAKKVSYRIKLLLRQYSKDNNSSGLVHKHGQEVTGGD